MLGKIFTTRLYVISHSFLERFNFIHAIHVPIMAASGLSHSQISLMFVVHEVTRTIVSTYAGAFAQVYGPVVCIVIGLIIKSAGGIMLICNKCPYNALWGNILIGASLGFMLSKIEPHVYNIVEQEPLSEAEKEKLFQEAVFLRYAMRQLGATLSGMAMLYLFPRFGFNGIVVISILGVVLLDAIVLLVFGLKKAQQGKDNRIDNKVHKPQYKKMSLTETLKSALELMKKNKYAFAAVMLAGTATAVAYLVSDILKILFSKSSSATEFAKIYSIMHIAPVIVSVLMLLARKTAPIIIVSVCAVIGAGLFGVVGIWSAKIALICGVIYIGLFPIMKVALSSLVNDSIGKNTRFTANGISESICSATGIGLFIGFSAMSKIIHSNIAVAIVMVMVGLFMAIPATLVATKKPTK